MFLPEDILLFLCISNFLDFSYICSLQRLQHSWVRHSTWRWGLAIHRNRVYRLCKVRYNTFLRTWIANSHTDKCLERPQKNLWKIATRTLSTILGHSLFRLLSRTTLKFLRPLLKLFQRVFTVWNCVRILSMPGYVSAWFFFCVTRSKLGNRRSYAWIAEGTSCRLATIERPTSTHHFHYPHCPSGWSIPGRRTSFILVASSR